MTKEKILKLAYEKENKKMKKRIEKAFGKKIFLLGSKNGINYWLESPSWDCGWYWGFGYIETYTNNDNPQFARDIASHQHFDGLFFNYNKCAHDVIKEYFDEIVLEDKELWTLCELMKTAYIMRNYSDTIHRGGAHYTTNPCKEIIENQGEYNRINEIVLPELFKEIEKILCEENEL